MDTEPKPLDYRSPQAAAQAEVFSVAAFMASGGVAIVLRLDLLVLVPRLEQIFKDFGTKLPAVTQVLLDVSRLTARGGWIALLVLPMAMGFLAGLLQPASSVLDAPSDAQRRRRGTRWIGVIIILTTVALFMPMLSLIDAVSGK